MSKRGQSRDFGENLEENFNEGYEITSIVGAREDALRSAKLVDIFTIRPDATQPRRAVPSAARAAWDGD